VPPAERIATFDNGGTLWVEKPLPNELYFVRSAVQELVAKNPALRERQSYKAAVEGDAALEYSKGRVWRSFQLLINHDDETREYAYAEKDNFSLDAAKKNGFTVVNIKRDWQTVFATAQRWFCTPG